MKIQTTLVLLSALALAASAQTQQQTPAPTSGSPVTQAPATKAPATGSPVTQAPAPTTKAPAATPAATKPAATPAATKPAATPAATATKPAATPASTTTTKYDTVKGCWSVSVERDATYCITGPICSGRGAQPAGWNCPKKGDVATERCLPYLKSYTSAKNCVAPVDAECKVIHTGAWGCVLKGDNATAVTPAPTKTGNTNSTNSTAPRKSDNGTIQAPTKLTNLAGVETTSSMAATIGAVAAVAAVACAAIGTVLYKKNQNKATAEDEQEVVDVVTP
ncbi:hypothetical protein PybrP1_011940 [[Pythium] brassicae (nom. inval.)]|nr:hypothetical protein PybrP1_011940 [[Pythium] brassicae (nom. inval.)]